ncbi:MAG: cell wall-binding repeat-containing protein [Intrasporangium sp.]|uniref:cell wall-binding repeat-containing protein n=1 Tax=Intrasporangium sp. TaxID=1925024 RepID=UPI002647C1BD|nr:cell wall-binding repeat-containing protein [Intrasporangium sp.]MDN5797140.1 cell wall-binding repeat-containing protein [Intrasporangium sp.]
MQAPSRASEAARLSGTDTKEARSEADGRTVHVTSASPQVALPRLAVVGVTWRQGSAPGTSVQYRTKTGEGWGAWQFVAAEDDHRPDPAEAAEAARRIGGARMGSAPIVTTGAADVQARLVSPTGSAPADPQIVVVDPGTATVDAGATPTGTVGNRTPSSAVSAGELEYAPAAFSAAVASKPTIYTRAQWGADESLREQSSPSYGRVEAAFVHHTAGTNSYTRDDVPGIIRGIYAYHVKSHGWRDIGYNFLVDKFGRIWEGRWGGMDKAVVGAHTYGLNSDTFGVSVLGNYEDVRPTSATTTALSKLIAWKATIHHFDVSGRVTISGKRYYTISGHRDAKDNSTACPGRYLYAKLPAIRKQTASYLPSVSRYAGSDRYATAAAISAKTFGSGVPVAYIATGAGFPDALAGAAAAGSLGGPVLLSERTSLPKTTTDELRRLKPGRIVVLGGTGVISSTVERRLAGYADSVARDAGTDRYDTAAQVSRVAFDPGAPVAYVATGTNFPDALAAGPAGGVKGGPVLLVGRDTIPAATATELRRLAPERIVVLGGTGVVSSSVEKSLGSYSSSVSRASGSDRFGTAARVSSTTFGAGAPIAFVATGATFPDAVAGGAAGGHRGGPILLTQRNAVPQATLSELARLKPERIVVLGGSSAVSTVVAKRLSTYEVP